MQRAQRATCACNTGIATHCAESLRYQRTSSIILSLSNRIIILAKVCEMIIFRRIQPLVYPNFSFHLLLKYRRSPQSWKLSNASPCRRSYIPALYVRQGCLYISAHTLHLYIRCVYTCARVYIEREEVCREDAKKREREREPGSNDQP